MTSSGYERLISTMVNLFYAHVRDIESAEIRPQWPLEPEQRKKVNRIEGISGYPHQIDVSVHCPKNLILVECKKWKTKVEVSHFLTFLGRVIDIEQKFGGDFEVHGSIATTIGFQRGVCKLAKYHRKVGLIVAQSEREYTSKFVGKRSGRQGSCAETSPVARA